MKRNGYLMTVFVGLALALGVVGGARAQSGGPGLQEGIGVQAVLGTGFTYQGQLKSSGSPVNGSCTFGFGLWNASSGGGQLGITQTVTTTVTNGLFTVVLNDSGQFGGSAFTGDARYLGIGVKCGSESSLTSLGRQTLTAAPYALYARNNWGLNGNSGTSASNFLGTTDNMTLTLAVNNTAALRLVPNATSPNIIGGYSGNSISAGVVGSTIGGGGASGIANTVSGNYGTVSGGRSNTASGISASTVGGGAGNTASVEYSTVGGGQSNTASGNWSVVGGGLSNFASANTATIGGGAGNTASGGGTTVGGGLNNTANGYTAAVGGGQLNTASGIFATVSGGDSNTASGENATVGGGYSNTVISQYATIGGGYSNMASGFAATVGGGQSNIASNTGATVGGGLVNTASGQAATVGGGYSNTASGDAATIPGGWQNIASGDYSFAAGQYASALHDGAFVWADFATTDPISSTIDNQFLVRASGGITLYTDSGASAGVRLTPGSGTWASLSDKNMKANFAPVDGLDILEQLMALPIQTWNYKTQDAAIQHIGPMAQDFYAAFNVGEDDTHITTVDADGVALAAIQGLYQVVQEKDAKIENQQEQINDLQIRMSQLEQQSGKSVAVQSPPSSLPLGWLLFGGLLLLNLGFVFGRHWNASKRVSS